MQAMKTTSRGFTLIELMVALAIFGLLIVLAGPQLALFLGNSKVRNATEAMLNGVQRTQVTAINDNTSARLVIDWTQGTGGWQILKMVDGTEPSPPNPVQVFSFREGADDAAFARTPGDANQITFDGYGRVIPNADASSTLRCIDVTNARQPQARPLRVIISNTVMKTATKLCDPNAAATEPQACPFPCS
jgi:type IV fimbrial biogenesis protein FimT